MRKHLLILLAVTLVIRGALYISYPFGAPEGDDDQSAHTYQIDRILSGDLLIGNLRYHTGYPLFIAPAAALSQLFGSLDDRVLLLVQVILSGTVPFFIYDILRTRRTPGEAFFVALLVALDPFGMQWAHFILPNWLIAFCFVASLWLIHRALLAQKRRLLWVALAGVLLGWAALARLNLAPVIAVLGITFFLLSGVSRRQQLKLFVTLGVSSVAVLALYLALIHYPSTGTWSLSCYTGTNLLVSVHVKDFDLSASNGPATQEYLNLLTLRPSREIVFTSDIYPRWSEPESWAAPEEYAAFINQPIGTPAPRVTTVFPASLFYYLGPCATDQLLLEVHNEVVRAQPLRWLVSIPLDVLSMSVQPVTAQYNPLHLPHHDQINFVGESRFGFREAQGDYYNGHLVWQPGIWLYSQLFNLWNGLKWLTPLAIVWALFSKAWVYKASSIVLIAFLVLLSIFGNPLPRLYAPLYPLWPLLIGGFLATLWRYWQQRRKLPYEVP